jgi:hypothetical protein
MRDRFYSTADLSRVCGVSISTIKRWTDAGLLRCVRTPGGHRKYRATDVAEAARRLGLAIVDAEATPAARVDELALLLLQGRTEPLAERLAAALASGDAPAVRSLLLDLHRHGMRLTDAGMLLHRALGRVAGGGEGQAAYRRHRATGLAATTLRLLVEQAPVPSGQAPLALVAASSELPDELAPGLALLLLAEARWRSVDLGRPSAEVVQGGLEADRAALLVLVEDHPPGTLAPLLEPAARARGTDVALLCCRPEPGLEMLRGEIVARERRLAAALV